MSKIFEVLGGGLPRLVNYHPMLSLFLLISLSYIPLTWTLIIGEDPRLMVVDLYALKIPYLSIPIGLTFFFVMALFFYYVIVRPAARKRSKQTSEAMRVFDANRTKRKSIHDDWGR